MTSATLASKSPSDEHLKSRLLDIGLAARAASSVLSLAAAEVKNKALLTAANLLLKRMDQLLDINAAEKEAARATGRPAAYIDRLSLTRPRVEAMAAGLEAIAALPDPVGTVITSWDRPNGLNITRVRVPLGVIGMIYESRPNVTGDAGGLSLKSGNAAILRGGSECLQSNLAIHACLTGGLKQAGLPETAIQLLTTANRDAVGYMLEGLGGAIDVIVPRGGKSLVERVQKEARIPVFAHLEGVCHVYVDKAADLEMARAIVLNAKLRRTGVCGAAETLLIDAAGAGRLLKPLIGALLDAGCQVRGDAAVCATDKRVVEASEDDWRTEYLDAIISAKLVDGVRGAMEHISQYGSQHTDAIVTGDLKAAETFLREVDSAIVLHNASTQFADGGEFGMGAEIGIATGRFHARGPVGVEQLTTFKYAVRGSGQIRPV